jgi:acyl transferase domain-containing protein
MKRQEDLAPREPIAIVGIGCRLPGGADNPDAFWKLLREGVDAISEAPSDRWSPRLPMTELRDLENGDAPDDSVRLPGQVAG